MDSKININRFAQARRRRRFAQRACPHCGGDVRSVRDIYGAYLQCLQCSREINPAALVLPGVMPDGHPLGVPTVSAPTLGNAPDGNSMEELLTA